MSDLERPIVIDCGAYNTKIGYAGNNHPDKEEYQYADDVPLTKFSTHPEAIQNGYIVNIEKMDQSLKEGLFGHMRLTTESVADHPVLIAESPLAPKSHSEQLTQHFFETYSVPGFFIANQGVLAMYCSGKVNGVVLDMGHSRSFVCPVYDGFALTHACEREPFVSGSEMTKYLQEILLEAEKTKQIQFIAPQSSTTVDGDVEMDGSAISSSSGGDSHVFSDVSLVNHVKHEVCFVSSNPFLPSGSSSSGQTANGESVANGGSTPTKSSAGKDKRKDTNVIGSYDKSFTLPDGTTIVISDTLRKKAAEMLFDPYHTCGKPIPNIAQTLFNCVQECEYDIRKELMSNVLLSGGVSNMSGMQARLKRELEQIAPPSTLLSVNLPSNSSKARDETVWCGGSILAGLPQMKELWIRKKDYNECGPSVVWRKVLS